MRRGLYFDLFADNHRKRDMHRISTSGSTGEPFVTYADRHQLEIRFATTLRALEWTGWRFGDRQARLWHQTIGMSRLQVVRERIDAWFMRRLFVPAFEIAPETLEDFVGRDPRAPARPRRRLRRVAELPRALPRRRAATRASRPKAIMSSAQTLPESVARAIENGVRHARLRQVRQPRVLGHRLPVRELAATTT